VLAHSSSTKGDSVDAKWNDELGWYPARIVEQGRHKKFKLEYGDGGKGSQEPKRIRVAWATLNAFTVRKSMVQREDTDWEEIQRKELWERYETLRDECPPAEDDDAWLLRLFGREGPP